MEMIIPWSIYSSWLYCTTNHLSAPEPNNQHTAWSTKQPPPQKGSDTEDGEDGHMPACPHLRPEHVSLLYSALGLKPRGIHSPHSKPRVPFSPQWAQSGHCLWCNFSLDSDHVRVSAWFWNPPPKISGRPWISHLALSAPCLWRSGPSPCTRWVLSDWIFFLDRFHRQLAEFLFQPEWIPEWVTITHYMVNYKSSHMIPTTAPASPLYSPHHSQDALSHLSEGSSFLSGCIPTPYLLSFHFLFCPNPVAMLNTYWAT